MDGLTSFELDEIFGRASTPAGPARLDESTIDAEEPARPYVPHIELEKIGGGEFGKAVADFSWNDEVAAPLEKRARTTEADRLGIAKVEIVEEAGLRIATAYDASGKVVGERLL